MKIVIVVIFMSGAGDIVNFQIPKMEFPSMTECEDTKSLYMEGLNAVEGYAMNPDLGRAESFCTLFPTWYLRKFDEHKAK